MFSPLSRALKASRVIMSQSLPKFPTVPTGRAGTSGPAELPGFSGPGRAGPTGSNLTCAGGRIIGRAARLLPGESAENFGTQSPEAQACAGPECVRTRSGGESICTVPRPAGSPRARTEALLRGPAAVSTVTR
eukprot:747775-Hanusia_phi.AAC.5